MYRTPEQLRTEGLKALRKRLGQAGMIRFLQQFDRGEGDYPLSGTSGWTKRRLTTFANPRLAPNGREYASSARKPDA